jgi:hypothetical protein
LAFYGSNGSNWGEVKSISIVSNDGKQISVLPASEAPGPDETLSDWPTDRTEFYTDAQPDSDWLGKKFTGLRLWERTGGEGLWIFDAATNSWVRR